MEKYRTIRRFDASGAQAFPGWLIHPALRERLAQATLGLVTLAIIGWVAGKPDLASLLPGHTPLPVSTGYALLFSALALLLATPAKSSAWMPWCAGAGLTIGLFSLVEPWLSLAFDPHAWLAAPFIDTLPGLPAHPTPQAALGLVLINLALLLQQGGGRWRGRLAQTAATVVLLGALVIIAGFVHENPRLYAMPHGFGVSPPAALALLLLAVGSLALQPNRGYVAIIAGNQLGSAMVRRLLPLAFLGPLLLSWLTHFGVERDWYDWHMEGAAMSVLSTLISLIALLIVGALLNRKNADLARTSELLEKTFAATHTLIAHLDRDFHFLKVNKAYADADGKTPQDFIGKNHFELYPGEENRTLFQKVLDSGDPLSIRARPFIYPDHPERGVTYWDWDLYPVIEPLSGRVEGLVLHLVDITDRHLADQRRLASERKFRALFEAAGDAIFIHRPGGNFITVNEVACQRLGYDRAELLALGPADIDSPEYAPRIAAITDTLKTQGLAVFESAHRCRDGSLLPVEISSRLIEYDGETVVMSIARDITARKAAETALRESRDATEALINATPESAILMDMDGTVRAINEIAAQRLHTTVQNLLGHDIYALFSPQVAANRRQMLARVAHTRLPLCASDSREGRHFEHHIYPIMGANGEVRQVAVYAEDVTERRLQDAIDNLLQGIDRRILRGESLSGLLDFTCDEIVRLFEIQFVWVGRKEADGALDIAASAGPAQGYLRYLREIGVRWDDSPQGLGPAGSTVRSGQPQIFHVDDRAFHPWRIAAERHGLRAILGLPLLLHGEVYGALILYAEQRSTFDPPGLLARFGSVAERLSVALELAMEHERIRLLSAALASASNGIFITDARGRIQWLNGAFSRLCGYADREVLGQTPRFLKSGLQDDAYYRSLWLTILRGDTWSAETVERHKDGHLYTVRQTITPIPTPDGSPGHFVSIMEDITQQKLAEARVRHMAHYDALTDLPNRALFHDRLAQAVAQARRSGEQVALFFLDLDKFKAVNDTLGHHMGDLLLQGVAQRLRECVRETDTVARLAGDEFTVILPGVKTEADAERVAAKIIARLAEPFILDGRTVGTAASIGIALAPSHAEDDETLIRLADNAMYAAKASGPGGYRVYARLPVLPMPPTEGS